MIQKEIKDMTGYNYTLKSDAIIDKKIEDGIFLNIFTCLESHLEAVKVHAKLKGIKKVVFDLNLSMRAYSHLIQQIEESQLKRFTLPIVDYNEYNLCDLNIKVISPEPKIETMNISHNVGRVVIFELKLLKYIQ